MDLTLDRVLLFAYKNVKFKSSSCVPHTLIKNSDTNELIDFKEGWDDDGYIKQNLT